MDCWENFTDTLKEFKEDKKLTHSQIIGLLGVDDNTWRSWLARTSYPSPKHVMKIADVFKCSADYLFGFTDKTEFTPKELPAEFIPRLTALEKEKRINDNRVAKYCEINNSVVSKWRTFNRFPRMETMLKLKELFGCSLEYLFGRED